MCNGPLVSTHLVLCDGNRTLIWLGETFNVHEKLVLNIYVRYLSLVFSFNLDVKYVIININLIYLKYFKFIEIFVLYVSL